MQPRSPAIDRYLNGGDPILEVARENAHLAEWFAERRSALRRRERWKRRLFHVPGVAVAIGATLAISIIAGAFVLFLSLLIVERIPRRGFPISVKDLGSSGSNKEVLLDLWMAGVTGADLLDNYVAEVGPRTLGAWLVKRLLVLFIWTLFVATPAIVTVGTILWPHMVLWAVGAYYNFKFLWSRSTGTSTASHGAAFELGQIWVEKSLPKLRDTEKGAGIKLKKISSGDVAGFGCGLFWFVAIIVIVYFTPTFFRQPIVVRNVLRVSTFFSWAYGLVPIVHYAQGLGALLIAAVLIFLFGGVRKTSDTDHARGRLAYEKERPPLTAKFDAYVRSAIIVDYDWKNGIVDAKEATSDGVGDGTEEDDRA